MKRYEGCAFTWKSDPRFSNTRCGEPRNAFVHQCVKAAEEEVKEHGNDPMCHAFVPSQEVRK